MIQIIIDLRISQSKFCWLSSNKPQNIDHERAFNHWCMMYLIRLKLWLWATKQKLSHRIATYYFESIVVSRRKSKQNTKIRKSWRILNKSIFAILSWWICYCTSSMWKSACQIWVWAMAQRSIFWGFEPWLKVQ